MNHQANKHFYHLVSNQIPTVHLKLTYKALPDYKYFNMNRRLACKSSSKKVAYEVHEKVEVDGQVGDEEGG